MILSTLSAVVLVFNELMAANVGTVMSPACNFDSWVEIYNPGDENVNLGGMYLSNDPTNPKLWKMPSDIGSVPAHGYKVVWLGSNYIKTNQAPFKLDCDGGTIILNDKNGQLIASQDYPEAKSRTSWARTVDGTGDWGWTADATPEASNEGAVFATNRLSAPEVSVGSKLFSGSLAFQVTIPEGATLMYTTDGSLPSAPKETGEEVIPWTEFIINGDCEGDDATSLISRDADGNGDKLRIVDGVGYNNSRGIRIHAIENPENDWDAQFFVYTPDHIWRSGEKYRFSMKVRADKNARISAQTHTTPHNYIYWSILDGTYNVTTQWQEISYEGTITDDQVGKQGGGGWWWGGEETVEDMQTIAFNLNGDRQENNFYFDDVSWELYTGDGQSIDVSQQSTDGQFNVTKTTNYTFRLFQDGFLPSVPVTRSFIKTDNQYTIPVISIVGNKKYFNDPKTGIDCDGDGTNGKTGNGQDMPKNYNMDWDRPVNFSYLSPDGEMLFNQDVNISVSGGWTRSQRYRSFKLKSNKVFDGQNRFDYSFFDQKPYIRNRALLVRNGGNDLWTHNARFMDPALETIIFRSGIDLDVQSYQPVIEYVNGELRGVLNLRETNNDKFVYANFGYDDEEIDMFENFEMKNGTNEVINRIFELGERINDAGVYNELKGLLDIDEFTNYMATELFLNNEDWPDNNIKAYRGQDGGRYRFISFDLDYAFELMNNGSDKPFTRLNNYKYMDFINFFFNLLGHDEYRRKFIDTFCIIAGSVFEPTRAEAIIDELLERVQPMNQLMQRVMNQSDGNSPERAANTIKQKLSGRADKMASEMQSFSVLKLSGVKKHSATLNADTEGAHLYVNGIEVPYSQFQGCLFAPVILEAKAPTGYEFAGWKKGSSIYSTEPVIGIPTTETTINLTATFKPCPQINSVRINEVSVSNGIYVNEHFKRNDWIELYNTTSEPVDVEGMYLSDNSNKPYKYQITKSPYSELMPQLNTVIPAHGYLIVWCDKLLSLSQLHASFKLDAEGGMIMLTAADKSWRERIDYSALRTNETIGRYPDGYDQVCIMNVPTIAQANRQSSYMVYLEQSIADGIETAQSELFAIHSTPDRLKVRGNGKSINVDIYNMLGQRVSSHRCDMADGNADIPISSLAKGYYIAHVTDNQGRVMTYKFKNE